MPNEDSGWIPQRKNNGRSEELRRTEGAHPAVRAPECAVGGREGTDPLLGARRERQRLLRG